MKRWLSRHLNPRNAWKDLLAKSRKDADELRAGYVRDAQRFTERPWRQSLRYAPLVGFAVTVMGVSLHAPVRIALACGVGAAIAWPSVYRFVLGPYARRKYL